MRKFLPLVITVLLCACKQKAPVDLAKLKFTEKASDIINFSDKYTGGVDNVNAPFTFALEATETSSFTFNGFKIDSADVIFQLPSDKVRKEAASQTGGHFEIAPVKTRDGLKRLLTKYKADSVICGYRVNVKGQQAQEAIKKQLTALYGPGTKNPNTDHGLYWNLKPLHRYIFFSPDYDMLIVMDNTHLSKTCYWDSMNGTIDFGGCNIEEYKKDLFK